MVDAQVGLVGAHRSLEVVIVVVEVAAAARGRGGAAGVRIAAASDDLPGHEELGDEYFEVGGQSEVDEDVARAVDEDEQIGDCLEDDELDGGNVALAVLHALADDRGLVHRSDR